MEKVYSYFVYAFFAVLAVVAFALLFPAYNNLKKMEIKLSELESKLDTKKAECTELRKRLNELENNPKAIEKIAREKFNMCKKDEIIYTYSTQNGEKEAKPEEKQKIPQSSSAKSGAKPEGKKTK